MDLWYLKVKFVFSLYCTSYICSPAKQVVKHVNTVFYTQEAVDLNLNPTIVSSGPGPPLTSSSLRLILQNCKKVAKQSLPAAMLPTYVSLRMINIALLTTVLTGEARSQTNDFILQLQGLVCLYFKHTSYLSFFIPTHFKA